MVIVPIRLASVTNGVCSSGTWHFHQGAIEAINVLTYTPSQGCLSAQTDTLSATLPLLFHYPAASLASAPLLLGRLNAGELGQTARMEENEGDG